MLLERRIFIQLHNRRLHMPKRQRHIQTFQLGNELPLVHQRGLRQQFLKQLFAAGHQSFFLLTLMILELLKQALQNLLHKCKLILAVLLYR